MRRAFLALVTSIVMPSAVYAATATWVSKASQVQYTVVHKFHEVTGVSKKTEAIAVLDGDGLKIMARAAVDSFGSGNGNRDAHMLEVVEASKYPLVVLRAIVPKYALPTTPGTSKLRLDAEVDLHGTKNVTPVDMDVTIVDAQHLKVSMQFTDSLTAHKIERPQLLFVPVDDALKISGTFDLELKQ